MFKEKNHGENLEPVARQNRFLNLSIQKINITCAGAQRESHQCARVKFENLKLILTFNMVSKSGFDRYIVFKLDTHTSL